MPASVLYYNDEKYFEAMADGIKGTADSYPAAQYNKTMNSPWPNRRLRKRTGYAGGVYPVALIVTVPSRASSY